MHGRVWSEGEGSSASPERSIIWHMHSAVIPADSNSFFKDGRKICVGTCALFKLSKKSQPFVGLIRWLALEKENNLQLGVNWLYRSSELKVGKSIWVDSAPNEIFYSFQTNEIPATSLLHPCKVAFLPRGVELPTGTSSFVCRRAYDTANKSLGWLTDQHYINDQQEEVDQLLHKTRTEMHVTLQSGGRSPKQANGPTSTSQLKASDSGQNSGSSFPSQAKGKKRERGDHGADSFKRERSLRLDDVDSIQCQTERNLKSEIARITEKGGLESLDGVEKLVQLMQPDKERKMDLASRSMLATVMALTDKVDCLKRFVQLRGLPVLDEWLQDIHKGKIGDGNNSKDGDRSVEEFLLVLLRALDKLPVNLQALQMCNIGRSVNHLRSHKNTDIQRKARTLVDTWKKGVEAEMISIDAKSGSTQSVSAWPSKSHLPEASHGGSRNPSGDVAMKSTVTQNSASKTASGGMKYETSSPGPVKPPSSFASGKENQPRTSAGGISDAPQTREDRSSSSNQSHNCGQSFSTKDDLKSSTSGSVTMNKISSTTARNRKINGFPGKSATGSQKEISSNKSSPAHKSATVEKLSHSAIAGEIAVAGPISEGNTHKIIVKIPNRVRSPAQCVSGGSLVDPTTMGNQASSPTVLNKHEQSDLASKEKSATSQSNVESDMNAWKNNDKKDVLIGSKGAESPAVLLDKEQSMTTEDSKSVVEVPPTNQLRSVNLHSSSFSPMNALIESCVKYSEATSSLSLGDDVGMNLLASVAAGEISISDVVSPTDSTERSNRQVEEVCIGDEAKSRSSLVDSPTVVQGRLLNDAECDDKKQAVVDPLSVGGKSDQSPSFEDIPSGDGSKNSSGMNLRSNAVTREISGKSNEKTSTTFKAVPLSTENVREGESNVVSEEKVIFSDVIADSVSKCGSGEKKVTLAEEKDSTNHLSTDECKPMFEISEKKALGEGLNKKIISEQKFTGAVGDKENLDQTKCDEKSVSQAGNAEEPEGCDTKIFIGKSETLDKEVDTNAAGESNSTAVPCSASSGLNDDNEEDNLEKQDIPGHISPQERHCPGTVDHGTLSVELTRSKSDNIQAEEDRAVSSSVTGATDPSRRMKFDLNEGLGADDGKYGELVTSTSSASTTIHKINVSPFSVNPIPGSHSGSVTAASAANRHYIPPDDLLRNKVELGWKGSAATSAFRPAEPRKVVEMTHSPSRSSCPDSSTSKSSRFPLDIDLNVPDERLLEEMACRGSGLAIESTTDLLSNRATLLSEASDSMPLCSSAGLDLDLNLVGEANDTGHCSTSNSFYGEASLVHCKPASTFHPQRDFDLNNGPAVDDASAPEHFSNYQPGKGVVASRQPSAVGLTMNNPGLSSFSSWFPPGTTFSTTSILPDRGEQSFPVIAPGASQRTFGPAAAVTPFNPDVYRGSVLSSSPAVPFPSSPFQFPVFPFGTTYPLPSSSFSVGGTSYPDSSSAAMLFAPPVNSPYLGPVVSVAPQFQRPYMVGLPDANNNGGWVSNRKWGRQGLDLNAGPITMESESKEEMFSLSSGQHSVASLQALAEEQTRMFSGSSGILKRKEPEGGVDNESFRQKHSPWQ